MSNFTKIRKFRTFNNKRFTLKDAFVTRGIAQRLKAKYKQQGYQARIHEQGGVMHFKQRFHIYIRKGR